MLEIFVLFLFAMILGYAFIFLLRVISHFNKNRPSLLKSVPLVKKKDRQLIDTPFTLILFPAAIQAILLSHVPLQEEVTSSSSIFYAIAIFLLLNMVAYILVINNSRRSGK